MNISPVSFGRTIKVNAPINVAHRMAELINQNRSVKDIEEKSAQQRLKTIFYDSNVGSAQALDINGESYIVTGETSHLVSDIRLDSAVHIMAARKTYGDSKDLARIREEEIKRCNEYLSIIVQMNKEALSINTEYTDTRKISSKAPVCDSVKIKSVNVVL